MVHRCSLVKPEPFLFPGSYHICVRSEISWVLYQLVVKIFQVFIALFDTNFLDLFVSVNVIILLHLAQIVLKQLYLLAVPLRRGLGVTKIIGELINKYVCLTVDWHFYLFAHVLLDEIEMTVWFYGLFPL